MSLLIYNAMFPSSFRGAAFDYKNGSVTAGRKTVVHEYPNKNIRFVEDLGKNQRTFEITAIIKGLTYFIDKKNLEEAMTQEGLGILVHPFYGNVNVYPLGYTVSESITEIGMATFSLSFAEAQRNISPRVTGNNTALIANAYRDLYDTINDAINAEWTLKFIRNIGDAVQQINRIINTMKALARVSNSVIDGRNDFNKSSDNFERNKYVAAQDSSILANNFTQTISDFDSLTTDPISRFDINNRAYGVGVDDTILDDITLELKERDKNHRFLNGAFNFLVLTNLIQTATIIDYTDELQLNNIQYLIDTNYNDLISNNDYLLTNQLRDSITSLRNEGRKFFDNIRLTVAKITQIQTNKIPAAVLSYQYYGSTDNYQEIIDLNNITNPAVIEGKIKILEETAL